VKGPRWVPELIVDETEQVAAVVPSSTQVMVASLFAVLDSHGP
jgi:hypothetical protein